MAEMLRDVLNFFRLDQKEPKNDQALGDKYGNNVATIKDDQPRNPYTEIKILSGHSDRIHLASRIDEERVLTSAHDNTVAIWDVLTGNLLFKLYGHTKPVNCVHIIDYDIVVEETIAPSEIADKSSKVLLTASFDKTIRLWSLSYGNCLKVITSHDYAIKCFIKLRDEEIDPIYCSGGDHLSVWDHDMNLLYTYKRRSLDFLQILLSVKGWKIIAATDKHYLTAYSVKKTMEGFEIQRVMRLPTHREPVTCLIHISDAMFASASLDGTIMLWTTYHLSPTRLFNEHEQYKDTSKHSFMYKVQHMFALEQRYIFAAIANGFQIFDAITGRCILKQPNAHFKDIAYMALIGDESILATCSVDGTTRLWGHRTFTTTDEIAEFRNATTPLERIIGKRMKLIQNKTASLELIGECAGHSDSVQFIVSCGKEGFLTCGASDVVILWKDGHLQLQKENELIKSIIRDTCL